MHFGILIFSLYCALSHLLFAILKINVYRYVVKKLFGAPITLHARRAAVTVHTGLYLLA